MTARPSPTRRLVVLTVSLLISGVFLWLAFRKVQLGEVWQQIAKASLPILALSLLTKLGSVLSQSLRAQVLLRPLHPYPYLRLVKSTFLAYAGNNVLPFRIGELLRINYLARHGDLPHSSCLAVMVVERLLDLGCLLLILAALLPQAIRLPGGASIYIITGGVVLGMAICVVISRRPDVFIGVVQRLTGLMGQRLSRFATDKARSFATGLSSLASPAQAGLVFLLSVAFWSCSLGSVRIWLWSYDLSLAWYAPGVILVFIAFGTALPSAPSYIGTYHYFLILALGTLGVTGSVATSFAIVGHAMASMPVTLTAVLVLARDQVRGELVPLREVQREDGR